MAPRRRIIGILSLSFWTAVGLVCGLQIWISMITHGHALWRVLAYQVLIWDAWFVLSPGIGWLARRFPLVPPTARAVVAHAVAALVIAPIHSLWWAMLLLYVKPYDAMGAQRFSDAFWWIGPSGLPQQLCFYCGVLAAHYAAEYYEKYRDRERTATRLEVSLFLHALGHRRVFFLRAGLHEWLDDVMSPTLAADAPAEAQAAFDRVAELSRWFGGTPRRLAAGAAVTPEDAAVARRRRGC